MWQLSLSKHLQYHLLMPFMQAFSTLRYILRPSIGWLVKQHKLFGKQIAMQKTYVATRLNENILISDLPANTGTWHELAIDSDKLSPYFAH